MRSPISSSSVKQEFLRKWLKGLRIYGAAAARKEMSIHERKKAIKLSADLAMASTRISTRWSRAIMANASSDAANKAVVAHVLSDHDHDHSIILLKKQAKRVRSKKILRKSCSNTIRRMRKSRSCCNSSNSIAKRLILKRTKVLKRLVPGGELMVDEICLMRETLDYILSLRLQVDVMRHLANNAAQKLDLDILHRHS